VMFFFFASRRRHTRSKRDWSSDVCSSDLGDLQSLTERAREHSPRALTGRLHRLIETLKPRINFLTEALHRRHDLHISSRKVNGRSEERRVGKECGSAWAPDGDNTMKHRGS